ncbi:MAG: 50S ribosomal protein L23 [Erysipelothrix sp.]|nr:50S ribosomal protein L23 [Erysipelothrix sp.]
MSRARDIIIRPVITEKSMHLTDDNNTVTFVVAKNANKTEVKLAVEEIFKVKVERVNTINVRAKKARMGQHEGFKSSYKKAIIKLAEGHSIDIFEER